MSVLEINKMLKDSWLDEIERIAQVIYWNDGLEKGLSVEHTERIVDIISSLEDTVTNLLEEEKVESFDLGFTAGQSHVAKENEELKEENEQLKLALEVAQLESRKSKELKQAKHNSFSEGYESGYEAGYNFKNEMGAKGNIG